MKNKDELNEKLSQIAGHFYILAQQYFGELRGKEIPQWEKQLQLGIDMYGDLREKFTQ